MKRILSSIILLASLSCNSSPLHQNQLQDTIPQTALPDTAPLVEREVTVDTHENETTETAIITVSLCGDIMMGTTYPTVQLPANNGRDIFSDTKQITQRTTLALGNLEGAMCDGGTTTKGGANSYAFRMPTSFAPLLSDAGYDFLSMANNHANDFGPTGIASTEHCLDAQGIKYAGIKGRAEYAIVERDGVRFGICAFGHNSYTLRHSELQKVESILKNLRQQADIVIVSFHGGAEGKDKRHLPYGTETFLGENRGDLRAFAHFCIDHGADLIYGHGPHVCRAMEVYKGHFIAYSLGNFCTPYGMNLTGISGYAPVVEVNIDREGLFQSGQIHSFIQQRGVGPRKDANNSVAREIRQLTLEDMRNPGLIIDNTGSMKKN